MKILKEHPNTKDTRKTILCYGDSNTYGYDPEDGGRYPVDVRWTGRLADILGSGYHVVEEGCNGRTTIYDDPLAGWKNGLEYLKPCIYSHKPIDIVILMLGSNDLKRVFGVRKETISKGIEKHVDLILHFTRECQGFVPKLILVSPPHIGDGIGHSPFFFAFSKTAVTLSKEFSEKYKEVAHDRGCIFFDAAEHVEPSERDSLHLTPKGHEILADQFSQLILSMDQ